METKIKEACAQEHRQASNIFWRESLMERPLREVVSASLNRAAPLCLDSAVNKIVTVGTILNNQARGTRSSVENDMAALKNAMKNMEKRLTKLNEIHKTLRKLSKTSVVGILNKMERPLDDMRSEAGRFVKTLAKTKGEELQAKEEETKSKDTSIFGLLMNSMRSSGRKKEIMQEALTGNEPLEFDNKEEANEFRRDLNNAIQKSIKDALQKVVASLEPTLKEEQDALFGEMSKLIQPVIKDFEEETKNLFDIDLNPPVPELPSVRLDIDIIACVNINKRTEHKTRYERRWITLMLWRHKVEYSEDIYRVSPSDIRRNLEDMLKDKIADAKESVSEFIGGSFNDMMQQYFNGINDTIAQAQSITEKGIATKKMDAKEQEHAKKQWRSTQEELEDFLEATSDTKKKLTLAKD